MISEYESKVQEVQACINEWVNGDGPPDFDRAARIEACAGVIRKSEHIRRDHVADAARREIASGNITAAEAATL